MVSTDPLYTLKTVIVSKDLTENEKICKYVKLKPVLPNNMKFFYLITDLFLYALDYRHINLATHIYRDYCEVIVSVFKHKNYDDDIDELIFNLCLCEEMDGLKLLYSVTDNHIIDNDIRSDICAYFENNDPIISWIETRWL